MKVKIRSIIDHGHDNERTILNVSEDTDIGEYLVMMQSIQKTKEFLIR